MILNLYCVILAEAGTGFREAIHDLRRGILLREVEMKDFFFIFFCTIEHVCVCVFKLLKYPLNK